MALRVGPRVRKTGLHRGNNESLGQEPILQVCRETFEPLTLSARVIQYRVAKILVEPKSSYPDRYKKSVSNRRMGMIVQTRSTAQR